MCLTVIIFRGHVLLDLVLVIVQARVLDLFLLNYRTDTKQLSIC